MLGAGDDGSSSVLSDSLNSAWAALNRVASPQLPTVIPRGRQLTVGAAVPSNGGTKTGELRVDCLGPGIAREVGHSRSGINPVRYKGA